MSEIVREDEWCMRLERELVPVLERDCTLCVLAVRSMNEECVRPDEDREGDVTRDALLLGPWSRCTTDPELEL